MSSHLERIRHDLAELAASLERFAEHHEECERCRPPHDNKPRLRPHTVAGWFQVWSGGVCIALLAPEDINGAGLRQSVEPK